MLIYHWSVDLPTDYCKNNFDSLFFFFLQIEFFQKKVKLFLFRLATCKLCSLTRRESHPE